MLQPAPSLELRKITLNPRAPWIDLLLLEAFHSVCEVDVRRAISCSRSEPSRYDISPLLKGSQRFDVYPGDAFIRAQHASQLSYTLKKGSIALDLLVRVLKGVLRPLGATFSLEFDRGRLSAYTINFG